MFLLQMTIQDFATGGRKTQTKTSNRFGVEAAILQIGTRNFALRGSCELAHKKGGRLAMHLGEGRALLILAALLRRVFPRPRNRNATFFSDDANRFREGAFLHLDHELEHVAAHPTPKAVINLFCRMHSKRRGLLGMKRA